MKNAILIHGTASKEEYFSPLLPSLSNANWHPWVQQQLIIKGIPTQVPEMPNAWKPDYATWQKEFERYDITPETMLVGHSCGAGFIVRWLSGHKDVRVAKVVLVAPSLGLDWDEREFFDFEFDSALASRTAGLHIYGSDNDKDAIKQAIQQYRTDIEGATYREFVGYGHFASEDIGTGFPELVAELLKP